MYTTIELLSIGLFIGTFGTLIGAGGGFILVPFLLLTDRSLTPEIVTAISIAIVAANALSGSVAYARSGRVDYKAGLLFALFTLPGSVLGVLLTAYIPKNAFKIFFGLLLLLLSALLLIKKKERPTKEFITLPKGWKHHTITDKMGITFSYSYNQNRGIFISIIVGFLSPLLGIGGGIIHVPALIQWLYFPVYIATATSHFILAIMSVVSVVVHVIQGNYDDAAVLHMVIFLAVGAIAGAQLGAFISHKIKTNIIVRILAVCLGLVGLRLMLGNFL
jgi:uncharacterized protein